jgi:Tol biopolymer transport system component/DNA-binding winged helix-turn-helix (wHTH) protein
MKTPEHKILPDLLEFGPYRLDTRDRLLFKNGNEVHLTPKVVEILLVLLKRHGHVVGKEELMNEVWPDTIVEDNNLTRNISTLRKTLNAESENSYIETIPRRGYRFVAEVREVDEGSTIAGIIDPAGLSPEPETEPLHRSSTGTNAVATPPETTTAGFEDGGLSQSVRQENAKTGPSRLFKRAKPVSLLNTALLLIIAALLFWQMKVLYRISWPTQQGKIGETSQRLNLSRHPGVGLPVEAALSPDGKYMAYATSDESGQQSLYLSQVNANDAIRLVPPGESKYFGLSFAPGGSHIYYIRREENQMSVLYRMTLPGSEPPQKLASLGLSSPVGLSPDGVRIAFVRESAAEGTSALIVANADGSAERKLVERKLPDFFSSTGSPSWSIDGQTLVCVVGSKADGIRYQVATIPVHHQEATVIHEAQWPWINQAAWLPDGSGLLILADEQPGGWRDQLWLMTWPEGKLKRITNDLNDYSGISPAADSNSLVTVQSNYLSDIWVVPHRTGGRSQRVTPYNDRREGLHGLDWTPDGRLVFTSMECGREHIWSMSAEGSQRRDLTLSESAGGNNHSASVSPDGRHVVFVSDRQGQTRVWRMDIDGNHPQPLTEGIYDLDPQVSSDGQWVIYSSMKSGKRALWKVPLAGGTAIPVTDLPSEALAVAPTGNLIAYAWREGLANPPRKLVVLDLEERRPPRFLALPGTPTLIRWMSDGRALSYILIREGIANLWGQPLTGGQPMQITDLSFENVASFAWSRDGKRLALTRVQEIRSIVFISGIR